MIKNDKFYLGIDLGTSAAKAIARNREGLSFRAKQTYAEETPNGWLEAVKQLISQLNIAGEIAALSISAQVGTYVVNGRDVISWRADVGREELIQIKQMVSDAEFVESIGMKHPDLISYPLSRLLYIQKYYRADAKVVMPKELLIEALTGQCVTDIFSMRGIAHPKTAQYATALMEKLGITLSLPALKRPTDLAGFVTEQAATEFGLPVGIPVYLGCNDFFAGLLGMGAYATDDAFDLSGTSEHIGYLSNELNTNGFVSGHFFNVFCTYGGTKASGASCNLAIDNFGIEGIDLTEILSQKPPVFLPYLTGERAPIFDENTRGVFFGLSDKTDRKSLAYATLEGVVFSLYHIGESMAMPKPKRLICGGGSARNPLMNTLRATLFDCETVCVSENDTSALGACMLAMVGDGVYADIQAAIADCVRYLPGGTPCRELRDTLLKRFAVYKALYPSLKDTFEEFNNIEKEQKQ